MRIPINNDSDLKAAVDLVDKNDKITSLRVFLTLPSPGNNYKTHSGQGAGPSNTYPDSSYGSQAHVSINPLRTGGWTLLHMTAHMDLKPM